MIKIFKYAFLLIITFIIYIFIDLFVIKYDIKDKELLIKKVIIIIKYIKD